MKFNSIGNKICILFTLTVGLMSVGVGYGWFKLRSIHSEIESISNEALPLTGVILTKTDGDARGGAALSVRAITGKPIKFLGIGETACRDRLNRVPSCHDIFVERMSGFF